MLATDRYSLADIAEVIAGDAALAATVLAAANAALLSVGPPITSLSRAVNRLGARAVGAIAVANGVSSAAVSAGVLLDIKFSVWRRTMTCALICQKLGPARGLVPEESFLSGLLHGFGRSIAVACIEQLLVSHQVSTTLTAEEWLDIAEQQRAPLARALSLSWQLPPVIADAIDDKQRGVSALNDLVLDADAIADDLVAGRTAAVTCLGEARLLEELFSRLPAALDAFSSADGAASKLATSKTSVVAKPDHVLSGALHTASLPVVDRRAKGVATLSCVAIGPTGIEVRSSRRYQECAVVRLAVGDAELDFEPWFTVVLCVADGPGHRVEFQLFSPSREVREQWLARYEAADRDSRTSTHQRVAAFASLPLAVAATGGAGKG